LRSCSAAAESASMRSKAARLRAQQ
jgi:hypothetical protein